MHHKLTTILLATSLTLAFSSASFAGPREDQLAQYASAAKAADPTFAGFSAARGKTLHTQTFTGGKPTHRAAPVAMALTHVPAGAMPPAGRLTRWRCPQHPRATPIQPKSRSGSSAIAPKSWGANAAQ